MSSHGLGLSKGWGVYFFGYMRVSILTVFVECVSRAFVLIRIIACDCEQIICLHVFAISVLNLLFLLKLKKIY